VTLNGIMAVILCYFTDFHSFGDLKDIKVVEVRPILPATKVEPEESSFEQCMIYGDILSDY